MRVLAASLLAVASVLAGGAGALLGTCGPFTDTLNDAFCPFVLEVFYMGITTGTTPTTYDPSSNVTRLQMAAFLARTVDRVLQRGSRRAALDQFWTSQNATVLGLTTVGIGAERCRADGADVWVSNSWAGTVSRVRASDGKLLETWTGATFAEGIIVAMGKVVVTGQTNPGSLYAIDPSQPAGAVTTVASTLGGFPFSIAFDGARFWTADTGVSVSIVTPGASIPWTVTTVTAGFTQPAGILYDGSSIWVANGNKLQKLDGSGAILQTVTLGSAGIPVFDGSNIWVPGFTSNSVSVVRASTGALLATLTGNGLNSPFASAFDGQRVLVTNYIGGDAVSLFKAADLTPIGFVGTGVASSPFGACSDGIHFWVALSRETNPNISPGVPGWLARF